MPFIHAALQPENIGHKVFITRHPRLQARFFKVLQPLVLANFFLLHYEKDCVTSTDRGEICS